ncbi:MAG: type I-E CRISPR-associated endonuclease Cas1e [Candidatus Sumerlaeaceae bacterium]
MTRLDHQCLPKVADSYGWLYIEHAIVDRDQNAITILDQCGRSYAPCASICFLMLGPGVSITHAAVALLCEHGCSIGWVGEHGVRTYASSSGVTKSSRRLLHQARLWADEQSRMAVVRNLYQMRFAEKLPPTLTLRQIRGMEGMRVREAYANISAQTGVPWRGRTYRTGDWDAADPVNRALSAANACLYGVCHAAIVSAGYSPAIGFIHTGTMLAFVYDVADLYKTQLTIPVAFQVVAEDPLEVERRTRLRCRDRFHELRILSRIVEDIHQALMIPDTLREDNPPETNLALWDPETGTVPAGRAYGGENEAQSNPPPETKDHGRHDS